MTASLFSIVGLFCAVTGFLLAVFAFLAGRQKFYNLIMLFHIAVGIWGLGAFIAGSAEENIRAILGWKISFTGGYFIAPIFFQFVEEVTGGRHKKCIYFGFFQAIVFTLLTWTTPLMFGPIRKIFDILFFTNTWVMTVAILLYLFFVILSYFYLVLFMRKAKGLRQWQSKWIAIGFAFGFVGGTSTLLPIFKIDSFYPLGNAGVFISAAILTYLVLWEKVLELKNLAQIEHRNKLAAISTLAASMNHEIRNPLYILKSHAETLLDSNVQSNLTIEEKNEKMDAFAGKVLEQSTRAMDVMQRFSSFAKNGADEEVNLEQVNVKQVLSDVLQLLSYEIELEKIKIENNIPNELEVNFDKRHLEQIFFNLIRNACQEIPHKGKLSISASILSSSGLTRGSSRMDSRLRGNDKGHVQLTISDNGPGIPKDRLKQIFEPFYSTKEEGSGVGLYVTKQLVERNNGKISVDSRLGEGTTFTLELKRESV